MKRYAYDMTEKSLKKFNKLLGDNMTAARLQIDEHINKFVETKTRKGQIAGLVNGVYYHVRYYRGFADIPCVDDIELISEDEYLDYVLHGLSMR